MNGSPHIVVVDDDPQICRLLERFLGLEGYGVSTAGSGDAMRSTLASQSADLVILDLMLPGEDGLTLARELRSSAPELPVIMLTGKQDTVDKVVGLELGADDYITKPFDQRELLARIRSVLRRARNSTPEPAAGSPDTGQDSRQAQFQGWTLDFARRDVVDPEGNSIHFTTHEYDLLAALVRRAHHALSRDQIMDLVAEREHEPFDRSIDVLVGKVRRKLDDDPKTPQFIKTIRGVGYMFVAPVEFR